jgi:pimeloyl-ACP methyl ester carboxylesterase
VPVLERPDGARINYEVRGDGPLVVLALGFAATPQVYEGIVSDLAQDHRVVTWDPRGCGQSSQEGPYDVGTDAEDLTALIEEVGAPAVVFGVAHGVSITARALRQKPDLVKAMVTPGVATALIGHLDGTEGFAGSRTVIDMLIEQLRRDPRGSVRATIDSLNPQMTDAELKARVDATLAYASVDSTLERIESWLEDADALAELRALGGRLGVQWHEHDTWQAGAMDRVVELLPEAVVRQVEDGPLSRPDLAADMVRELE